MIKLLRLMKIMLLFGTFDIVRLTSHPDIIDNISFEYDLIF